MKLNSFGLHCYAMLSRSARKTFNNTSHSNLLLWFFYSPVGFISPFVPSLLFCKHSHKNWATLYQSMRVLSARRFTRNCVRKRNPKTFSQFDALDNYSVSYARVISRLPVALLHFPHVVNMRSRSQTNAVAVLPATLDLIVVVWCVVMGSCFWYKTFMITPCVVWSLIHVRHHNELCFWTMHNYFPIAMNMYHAVDCPTSTYCSC